MYVLVYCRQCINNVETTELYHLQSLFCLSLVSAGQISWSIFIGALVDWGNSAFAFKSTQSPSVLQGSGPLELFFHLNSLWVWICRVKCSWLAFTYRTHIFLSSHPILGLLFRIRLQEFLWDWLNLDACIRAKHAIVLLRNTFSFLKSIQLSCPLLLENVIYIYNSVFIHNHSI